MFFTVLQQGATNAVHNTFGRAGGAGGIHDKQRVGKRRRIKIQCRCVQHRGVLPGAGQRRYMIRARQTGYGLPVNNRTVCCCCRALTVCALRIQIRHQHQRAQGRQASHELFQGGLVLNDFTRITMCRNCKQDRRFNLGKAVQNSTDAKIRRAG